ncbi:hypothetical protein B0H16DRAFT_1763448 [Mycena metata]|uniref:Uncharacterized protein n=1 Tax=Mycena metata TaxID=1033252 RepID=A0AAD7JXE2_9AGAR|nr:hypothetical protein B0H16DRAFT_1763448 [Mycena metata]
MSPLEESVKPNCYPRVARKKEKKKKFRPRARPGLESNEYLSRGMSGRKQSGTYLRIRNVSTASGNHTARKELPVAAGTFHLIRNLQRIPRATEGGGGVRWGRRGEVRWWQCDGGRQERSGITREKDNVFRRFPNWDYTPGASNSAPSHHARRAATSTSTKPDVPRAEEQNFEPAWESVASATEQPGKGTDENFKKNVQTQFQRTAQARVERDPPPPGHFHPTSNAVRQTPKNSFLAGDEHIRADCPRAGHIQIPEKAVRPHSKPEITHPVRRTRFEHGFLNLEASEEGCRWKKKLAMLSTPIHALRFERAALQTRWGKLVQVRNRASVNPSNRNTSSGMNGVHETHRKDVLSDCGWRRAQLKGVIQNTKGEIPNIARAWPGLESNRRDIEHSTSRDLRSRAMFIHGETQSDEHRKR